MIIIKSRNCLELHYNLAIADKICPVFLLQLNAFVIDRKLFLAFIRDVATLKFYLKSFLIHRFEEARTQNVVDMHCCTYHLICFVLIDNVWHNNYLCTNTRRLDGS